MPVTCEVWPKLTGAYLARDIRVRVTPPVVAFDQESFDSVLKAFDNFEERSSQKAEEFFSDVADWAQDHAYSWHETMVSLRQSTRNLLAAGLFHLVEQQLSVLSIDCVYAKVSDTNLNSVKTWYRENLGIELASLESWKP